MHKIKSLFIILGIVIAGHVSGINPGNRFFVSPTGSDSNPGTKSQPFQTLERARDAIRQLKTSGTFNGCEVFLRKGTYFRKEMFVLREKDSGTESNPIAYRAYKNEKVILHGGTKIETQNAHKITDAGILSRLGPKVKGKIVEIDLANLGLHNLGKMRPVGFSRPYRPVWAELFVNGEPYSIARWPNDSTLKIGEVTDTGSVPRDGDFSNRGGAFKFGTDRPLSWKSHNDIWISGYFKMGWAEDAVQLAEIDTVNRVFKTKQPSLYGFGTGKKFSRYYIYNVLEEVDKPGLATHFGHWKNYLGENGGNVFCRCRNKNGAGHNQNLPTAVEQPDKIEPDC